MHIQTHTQSIWLSRNQLPCLASLAQLAICSFVRTCACATDTIPKIYFKKVHCRIGSKQINVKNRWMCAKVNIIWSHKGFSVFAAWVAVVVVVVFQRLSANFSLDRMEVTSKIVLIFKTSIQHFSNSFVWWAKRSIMKRVCPLPVFLDFLSFSHLFLWDRTPFCRTNRFPNRLSLNLTIIGHFGIFTFESYLIFNKNWRKIQHFSYLIYSMQTKRMHFNYDELPLECETIG